MSRLSDFACFALLGLTCTSAFAQVEQTSFGTTVNTSATGVTPCSDGGLDPWCQSTGTPLSAPVAQADGFNVGDYDTLGYMLGFQSSASFYASLQGPTSGQSGSAVGEVQLHQLDFTVGPNPRDLYLIGQLTTRIMLPIGANSEYEVEFRIEQVGVGHRGYFVYPLPIEPDEDGVSVMNFERLLRLAPGEYTIEFTGRGAVSNGGEPLPDQPVLVAGDIKLFGDFETVPTCILDYNRDGIVDMFDYLDFTSDFGSADESTFSNTWHERLEADINFDGVVDMSDYLDFVAAWGNPPC